MTHSLDFIETWKETPGFPGYQVSELGNVSSSWSRGCRNGRFRIDDYRPMSPRVHVSGYLEVGLGNEQGVRVCVKVHHLVLFAFVGPKPEGSVCRHLDGDRSNNRLTNLLWGTPRENNLDTVRLGTLKPPSFFSPVPTDVAIQIQGLRLAGSSSRQLAKQFGLGESTIRCICKRDYVSRALAEAL